MTTRHFDHPILAEITQLGLPDHDNIVVNHSAALAIWGVDIGREPNDIDMATSLKNIRHLRQKLGWEVIRQVAGYHTDGTPVELLVTHDAENRFDVHRWDFSREQYEKTGRGRIYLPEQKDNSYRDVVTGIYVATPEYVLSTKRQTGRQKDEGDIEYIERYLRSQ